MAKTISDQKIETVKELIYESTIKTYCKYIMGNIYT